MLYIMKKKKILITLYFSFYLSLLSIKQLLGLPLKFK